MSPERKSRDGAAARLESARAFEAAQNLPAALDAYQQALSFDPDSLIIARHLADLAFRLGQWDMAEKLYVHLITRGEQDIPILCAFAATLREQARFDEAIELLKSLLGQHPGEAALWEGLGTIMAAKGERDTALVFLDEALRLAPDNLHAVFNRGCTRIEKGDLPGGLGDVTDCAQRFRDPANRANAALTCAHTALAMGDLAAGWRWYEARHMRGTPREVHYDLNLPRRTSGQSLAGKKLFVSAEQGLGDEILYGSVLPDIVSELGDGRLGIAVEPRLVPLFQRSFPNAVVVAHRTQTRDGAVHRDFPGLDQKTFDQWALMGDFLASHRGTIADFPGRRRFLQPDAARVAHWRRYFAALNSRPKAGVLWKSLKSNALRDRFFSGFEQWQAVLATPGIQFVNLQYGDTSVELAQAQAAGLDIHTPEGIDLKQDLDDLAALTTALDVVLGPSNATSNIAAACGASVWMVSPPRTWLALGETHYPWYAAVRLFASSDYDDWAPVLAQVAAELGAWATQAKADSRSA